jgi:ligand-binding SRPBCC domain-containing protein
MVEEISLRFESVLNAPAGHVWEWISSVKGIRKEMWPFLYMTAPEGLRSLEGSRISLGIRMFRSFIFLFGVLPIDFSDMTLIEFNAGQGFVEQSRMGSMKLWRHERHITPCVADSGSVLLVDQITFRPRYARHVIAWFIYRVFVHRHNVLKKNFNSIVPLC